MTTSPVATCFEHPTRLMASLSREPQTAAWPARARHGFDSRSAGGSNQRSDQDPNQSTSFDPSSASCSAA